MTSGIFLLKRKISYFKNHGCFIISYFKKIKKQILILRKFS